MTDRCPACPYRATLTCRPVPGSGPRPARVMGIGEGPGPNEDRWGRVFIGKTGREVDEQYFPIAGLDRADVYMTNAMLCYPPGGSDPDPYIVRACAAWHLPRELADVRPEVIILMGSAACFAVVPEIDLDVQHGIPFTIPDLSHPLAEWCNFTVPVVFPTWHPAAGLHETGKMIPLQADFAALRRILHGDWSHVAVDEFPNPVYWECATAADPDPVELWRDVPIVAIDTESDHGRPWCLSISGEPGLAAMVHIDNSTAIRAIADWVAGPAAPRVLLHNALYDLPVLARMGIVPRRWRCTMQMAYGLGGSVPQGLKALAYRLCGMRMRDYEDVVVPYGRAQVVDYLTGIEGTLRRPAKLNMPKEFRGRCVTCRHLKARHRLIAPYSNTVSCVGDKANPNCGCTVYVKWAQAGDLEFEKQLGGTGNKVRRLIRDMAADVTGRTINPWKRIREQWHDADRELVIAAAGGADVPYPTIAEIPRPEAVEYAARDADATLRVYWQLRRLRRELQRTVVT